MKQRHEKVFQFDALFEPNGSGYTVTTPQLPGLVTEGGTLKEAREMAKDAIRCYLEALLKEQRLNSSRAPAARKEKITVAA